MPIIDTVVLAVTLVLTQIPAQQPTTPYMHKVLYDAGIPERLWPEFLAVAACESWMEPDAIGDHGNAMGLFQIHWYIWGEWAYENGYAKAGNPLDPVQNARVAYAVGEFYSIPRGLDRWDQWSAKPSWPMCQDRAANLLY